MNSTTEICSVPTCTKHGIKASLICLARECSAPNRICCSKCYDEFHSSTCGQFESKSIFDATRYSIPEPPPLFSKILAFNERNSELIEYIQQSFEQLKASVAIALEKQSKQLIATINDANFNIMTLAFSIKNTWDFQNIFLVPFGPSIETSLKTEEHIKSKLSQMYDSLDKIKTEYNSSEFFDFSGIQTSIQALSSKIHSEIASINPKKQSNLPRCQEFKFMTKYHSLDVDSRDDKGYQLIRNPTQAYFDTFMNEDVEFDTEYCIKFTMDQSPSNAVTIGLADSAGLKIGKLDHRVSQSLYNAYHNNMGNVIKGKPFSDRSIPAGTIITARFKLSENRFEISDEGDENCVSVANLFTFSKDVKWRFFFSFFEPPFNITIRQSIKL